MEISLESQRLLQTHIHSVWELELIVLLRKSACPLTRAQICSALYLSPEVIDKALPHFVQAGILDCEQGSNPKYQYLPRNIEVRNGWEQLCQAYSSQRLRVINLIYSSQLKKVAEC